MRLNGWFNPNILAPLKLPFNFYLTEIAIIKVIHTYAITYTGLYDTLIYNE